MSIENSKQLSSHYKIGASWEGFALECVSQNIQKRNEELYFWRTHTGSKVDLFWQDKGKNWGIEFKYSTAPTITKSMQIAIKDLELSHLWIIYPGKETYRLSSNITVKPLQERD